MNCHCTLSEAATGNRDQEMPHSVRAATGNPDLIYPPPPLYCLRATTGNPDLIHTHAHARKRASARARTHTHTHTHTHTAHTRTVSELQRETPIFILLLSQSYNGKTRFLYTAPLAFRAAPGSGLHGGRPVRGARGMQHARGRCVHVRDAGFYKDVGRCLPLKPPGERCAGSQQCVNNAECSKTGQCQCSPGYYSPRMTCVWSVLTYGLKRICSNDDCYKIIQYQFNTIRLYNPSVSTFALGMFCGAKYTHITHCLTPIINRH